MSENGFSLIDMVIRSASLSLHKSLIGVAQLSDQEIAVKNRGKGSFRTSRALLTYYSVYHLFTASILLSDRYSDFNLPINSIYRKLRNGKYVGTITAEQLGNESEHPKIWSCQQNYERDMATLIKHSDIKNYCKKLRIMKNTNEQLLPFEDILYESFVGDEPKDGEQCIVGLYEKLCYVRDRVLYRPSFVLDNEGHLWQTSKDVRYEVDSLPTSNFLYTHIAEFIRHFIETMIEQTPEWWLIYYFAIPLNNREIDELLKMGHTQEEITRLLFNCGFAAQQANKKICVTSHISQLLELENIDTLIGWHNEFWKPLFVAAEQALFRRCSTI